MGTATDLESRATAIVARHFKRTASELGPDIRLREDLGGDSLDLLELTFELEAALGVPAGEVDLAEVRTLGDALRELERRAP